MQPQLCAAKCAAQKLVAKRTTDESFTDNHLPVRGCCTMDCSSSKHPIWSSAGYSCWLISQVASLPTVKQLTCTEADAWALVDNNLPPNHVRMLHQRLQLDPVLRCPDPSLAYGSGHCSGCRVRLCHHSTTLIKALWSVKCNLLRVGWSLHDTKD